MKTCYPVLIKNLPSQHMVTLSRLLEMATIPEELMDSLMTTTNSEVGNKMIINYLISLVHTEEHIITFCNFAEKMIGDPVKCGCVLNLRNGVCILRIHKCTICVILFAENTMCPFVFLYT